MTLYTVQVPDPPTGQDWVTTVPGQYLWNVKGVTANLATDPLARMTDSSGHGNDGQYTATAGHVLSESLGQPGVFADDASIKVFSAGAAANIVHTARATPTTMVWNGDFTIEFWVKLTGPGSYPVEFAPDDGGGVTVVSIAANGAISMVLANGEAYESAAIPSAHDGQWHYCAVALPFAANVSFTFDGTNPAIVQQVLPGLRVHLPAADSGWGGPVGGAAHNGWLDELAVYPSALTVLQRQAHFSASALGFAAYRAAVLANAPAMYFHLDDTGGPGGREVSLGVTDGLTDVEVIPSGFATPTTGNGWTYSWSPNLPARAQSSGAFLFSIPIPPLILPAGYTIGTRTPNLGPGDSWTDITVWWDSSLQDASGPLDAFAYPPGAHLVYHRLGAG